MAADEKKPSRREIMYDRGKDKKPAAKAESKSESKPAPKADDTTPAAAAEVGASAEGGSPMDKFVGEMDAINKRHEAERRDHHGNSRDALRQMSTRHAKDFKDLAQRQADEMAKMAAPKDMPAEGEAPGGATQVAEGAAPPVA